MSADERERAYLDHAATTVLRPAAREAFLEASAVRGNPSSVHSSGRRARGEDEGGTPGQQDPGDPTREDPEGDGPDEEAPTEGGSEEEQKDDELEQRNRDAQGGDGEQDKGGSEQDPVKPW